MGSLSKKWGKVKRWNSFLHQIFFCTICSSNQFNPRIKDLASQRKVHHEIILGTNVEVDFSAFVPSNGNLFCVKEQLMMLYITDFLCAGHRCPANWRPRKDIIYLFPFFGDKIFLKNGKFSCFCVVEWGSFCGSEERRRWHFTTDISCLNLTDSHPSTLQSTTHALEDIILQGVKSELSSSRDTEIPTFQPLDPYLEFWTHWHIYPSEQPFRLFEIIIINTLQ